MWFLTQIICYTCGVLPHPGQRYQVANKHTLYSLWTVASGFWGIPGHFIKIFGDT
jgi:hypothetical protein